MVGRHNHFLAEPNPLRHGRHERTKSPCLCKAPSPGRRRRKLLSACAHAIIRRGGKRERAPMFFFLLQSRKLHSQPPASSLVCTCVRVPCATCVCVLCVEGQGSLFFFFSSSSWFCRRNYSGKAFNLALSLSLSLSSLSLSKLLTRSRG